MCGTTYYTHEDVQRAANELSEDPKASGEITRRVAKLLGDVIPEYGTKAIIVGEGHPVGIAATAIALGVVLGLKLAGTLDFVNPNQDFSAEFNEQAEAFLASREAEQYAGMAGQAAAA